MVVRYLWHLTVSDITVIQIRCYTIKNKQSLLSAPLKINICEHPLRGLPAYPVSSQYFIVHKKMFPYLSMIGDVNIFLSMYCLVENSEFLQMPLNLGNTAN